MRCAFNVRFGSLSAIRLFYFSNMAAPVYWPSSVVAIKMNKCDHLETKNFMVSVRNTKLIEEVFNDHHPGAEGDEFEKTYTLKSQCKTKLNSTDTFEVENYLTVGELVNKFNIKCIEFACVRLQNSPLKLIGEAAESACLYNTRKWKCPIKCRCWKYWIVTKNW